MGVDRPDRTSGAKYAIQFSVLDDFRLLGCPGKEVLGSKVIGSGSVISPQVIAHLQVGEITNPLILIINPNFLPGTSK